MTLVFSGSEWVKNLCDKVFADCECNKDRSPRGLAQIERIEMLQDIRIHHFKHEWLVLSLLYKNERSTLHLERSWDHETDEGLEALIPPLLGERTVGGIGGQKKRPEYELAQFFRESDEEEQEQEREKREDTTIIFDIRFRQRASASEPVSANENAAFPLTLRTVCEILREYHDRHPAYILLGANCWAWSRAVLLEIIMKADNIQSIAMNMKSERVTPEQLKMYMFTEYGAWGGMLLHAIARHKDAPNDYSAARLAFMRVILMVYPCIPLLARFNTMIHGYLNWSFRLRRFSIYANETISENGLRCTYKVFPPDLTDLIPAIFGNSVFPLAHSHCAPGSYLYLLAPPIAALNARIVSVHLYLFGLVTSEAPSVDEGNRSIETNSLFECGILRHSENLLRLVENPGKCPLDVILRTRDARGRRAYAGIHAMDGQHPLVRALREGDMIAVWAKGHPHRVHKPAMVSLKVVTQRGVGKLEIICAIDTLLAFLRLLKAISLSPSAPSIVTGMQWFVFRLYVYAPYFLNKFCGEWTWNRISEVAKGMLWSVTPILLPDATQIHTELLLVDFLQTVLAYEPRVDDSPPSLGTAKLQTIELISYKPQHQLFERLVLEHYKSFLWSSHGFTQDVVKVYLPGELENSVRVIPGSKSVFKIHFRSPSSDGSDSDNSPTLHDMGQILEELKRNYWRYFWLNCQCWVWPYTAAKLLSSKFTHAISRVYLEGHDEVLDYAEATDILARECEGWKHAEMRSVYSVRGIISGKDILYVMRETRAKYIVWYFVVGVMPSLFLLIMAAKMF